MTTICQAEFLRTLDKVALLRAGLSVLAAEVVAEAEVDTMVLTMDRVVEEAVDLAEAEAAMMDPGEVEAEGMTECANRVCKSTTLWLKA